jgi:two-component system chemotaxis response regulator CheB
MRAVVVDDSAYNRQTIIRILEESGEVEVVGRAVDGEEGLLHCFKLEPDVVTLDLEMPKMDGFTFLRILMARRPTPVIVISSQARKQDVFKALELGALDFVAKPTRHISPELHSIRQELLEKVSLVRQLRFPAWSQSAGRILGDSADARARAAAAASPSAMVTGSTERGFLGETTNPGIVLPQRPDPPPGRPFRVVVLGASTGGPPALTYLLSELDPELPLAYVIAQHMPDKFTRAFADRLARRSGVVVREAQDGDQLVAGLALVAPGWADVILRRARPAPVGMAAPASPSATFTPAPAGALPRGAAPLQVQLVKGGSGAKFVPSVNALFRSAAESAGPEVLSVVLTGMGDDGAEGVRLVRQHRGVVLAESPDSAVIYGMPKEAVATGCVDKVLPLSGILDEIRRFGRELHEPPR